MTHRRKCVTATCDKQAQHRSGCCRTCERLRTGDPIGQPQDCVKCGRKAYGNLCVACRTGQTYVALRQKADAERAESELKARQSAPGVLYERKVGHRTYEVTFDGSVR